ncbi:methyltransferase domain-containing protein [Cyanobium sp. ATX 6F1]|nr:methyltransferase domain-containing protein [Cyanobium sp. ATX 6F1]
MELFERNWRTYRAVVDHDLMEHRALSDVLKAMVEALVRPGWAWADLGCGDLALLAPLLRALPLGRFEAVDAAAAVLPLAAANLEASAAGPVPFPCRWSHRDLLAWAEQPEPASRFELITCSYALHHLPDEGKQRALAALAGRLAPDGALLIADVFRRDGESRAAYIERYGQRVRESWGVLEVADRQRVLDHLSAHDEPAERDAFVACARGAGWASRWIWTGRHGAEALLLLWPASANDPSVGLDLEGFDG